MTGVRDCGVNRSSDVHSESESSTISSTWNEFHVNKAVINRVKEGIPLSTEKPKACFAVSK